MTKKNTLLSIPVTIILSFVDIFKYIGIGARIVFTPIKNIYLMSSSAADRTYKSAKTMIKTEKKEEIKDRRAKLSPKLLAKIDEEKKLLHQELNSADAKRLTEPTIFRYKAIDYKGKIVKDNFTGLSKLDVNTFLVNEGYDVFSIETNEWINFVYGENGLFPKKMKSKDLIFWLTQLSTYVKSGIPLTDSMRILAEQSEKNSGRKSVFNAIMYELTMGEPFSSALKKQGTMFPSLLINMLKAAEATGDLESTLDDMADYYTEIDNTKRDMISAMTYPMIITVFSVGIISLILLYIMPEFEGIYDSLGSEITGITKLVMDFSYNLQNNIFTYIIALIVFVTGIVFSYKKIKAFRKIIQTILMKIPIIKNIIIYNEVTIFTKTFASLLKNSVYITESMDILGRITNNEIYKDIMNNTIANISVGGKISETFKDHWAIPSAAYYMIVTGESTGELASMMQKVSDHFRSQHKAMINSFKSVIEPVMIAVLAVIVGIILLAVVMPMYGIYENLNI